MSQGDRKVRIPSPHSPIAHKATLNLTGDIGVSGESSERCRSHSGSAPNSPRIDLGTSRDSLFGLNESESYDSISQPSTPILTRKFHARTRPQPLYSSTKSIVMHVGDPIITSPKLMSPQSPRAPLAITYETDDYHMNDSFLHDTHRPIWMRAAIGFISGLFLSIFALPLALPFVRKGRRGPFFGGALAGAILQMFIVIACVAAIRGSV